MAFLRFAGTNPDTDSGVETGLFQIASLIENNASTPEGEKQAIRQELDWFSKHLVVPQRFNRTRSKGYYRRKPKGIAWFKDIATECLRRMYLLKRIIEEHGYVINIIREDRIGYIVYEDEFQAVAEPFSDTRTR